MIRIRATLQRCRLQRRSRAASATARGTAAAKSRSIGVRWLGADKEAAENLVFPGRALQNVLQSAFGIAPVQTTWQGIQFGISWAHLQGHPPARFSIAWVRNFRIAFRRFTR